MYSDLSAFSLDCSLSELAPVDVSCVVSLIALSFKVKQMVGHYLRAFEIDNPNPSPKENFTSRVEHMFS